MSEAGFKRGRSKQDFETPSDFIKAVEKRFGVINCDLAASKENTKGQIWIDVERNSLDVQWHTLRGNLWLNPPFDSISQWAAKCARESQLGAKILFLVPASVGSNWFADYVFDKSRVLFLNGRLQFVGAKDPYPKDCMLACYGFDGYKTGCEVWKWKI